ncbi:MAG TPA: hypothetical protein DEQ38_14475 [Elusimicrobia bacterium]|nr:MAG: hypothetical protein A2089_06810 [Elusimicrobia bacterium GWD2_63_28]HCC49298.1 hypothetical protein [Elusimicrobiota bacterium]
MRKVIFAEGEVYHIYNRGADKREVFLNDLDRHRFLQDLQEMNTSAPVVNSGYSFMRNLLIHPGSDMPAPPCCRIKGEKLVNILEFVLMPNHFHLLLTPLRPAGIQSFMQKLGTAYTMYFNKCHCRTGMLFQGPYQSVHIKREDHYEWIPHYIHANPLKLRPPLASAEIKLAFLRSYKWSSFRDYAGLGGFPEIVNKTLLEEFFARDGGFESSMLRWLKNRRDLAIEAKPR